MKKRISIITIITVLICSLSMPVNIYADINSTQERWKEISYIADRMGLMFGGLIYGDIAHYVYVYMHSHYPERYPSSSNNESSEAAGFIENNGLYISGNNISLQGDSYNALVYALNYAKADYEYVIGYGYPFYFGDNFQSNLIPYSTDDLVIQFNTSYFKYDSNSVYLKYDSLYGDDAYYFRLRLSDNVVPQSIKELNRYGRTLDTHLTLDLKPFCANYSTDYYEWNGSNVVNGGPRLIDYQDRGFYIYKGRKLPDNPNIPNYFETNNWTDNSTKGSFNTTKTEIDNSVHYGDVYNYITDSHDTNGTYPSPNEINIYIDNHDDDPTPTPTPTPDNPSGNGGNHGGIISGNTANGGNASASASANNNGVNVTVNNNHSINFNVPGISGNGIGNGTVSGNGQGSGGFFDWISDIGDVIGNFIKNVGQLIADVVQGITETITTILADIPNLLNTIVNFVYAGLPDELKALVTLGITAVVLVSVIKVMRK